VSFSGLEKKVKIKGESFSFKDLLLNIPIKYERKLFLEENKPIFHGVFYKFVFFVDEISNI